MPETAIQYMTLEEFLHWDDGTDTRWELIDGVRVAMAPPRFAHGVLAARLAGRVDAALRARPGCMVQSEAGIVRPDRSDTFYVADLAVSCARHDPDQQITQEPILIIEILSPTTIAFDRQVKIPDYRRVTSVQEIVAVDSGSVFAEVMRREGERWITEIVQGRGAILPLASIGLTVAMGELYEGIDVPEMPRPRSARRRRP
jgi:Uma2 family endonuclease